jgi:hypothetical protein
MLTRTRIEGVIVALLVPLGGCSHTLVEELAPQLTEVPGCVPERRLAPIHPSDTVGGVPRVFGTPENMIAAARMVPGGFAGIAYDTVANVWAIQLTDTTAVAAARAALVPLAPDTAIARALPTAPAQLVRWSIAALYDWWLFVLDNIKGLHPGLSNTFVGINYQKNVISFTLPDSATQHALERRLVELGIPCGIVRTRVGGPARVAVDLGR